MNEITAKRKELYILLPLGLFVIIFLRFFLGMQFAALIVFFAILIVSVLFLSTLKWRLLSYFFFSWLLLEGIFRKWIMPNYSTELFFVKHFLLLGPYFYMFTRRIKISKKHYPFLGLLLAYFAWGILEAINFRVTTDFRVQILGLITHFWFVPLIFLVPMVLDTEGKISKFFKITSYISIPVFILGVIQYYSSASSTLNMYVPSSVIADKFIAGVGGFVRITGVFSYITPYTTYLGISLMLILYLLITPGLKKFEIVILCVAISLGITNLIMTGSRAPVAVFLIQAIPFLLFSLKGRLKVRKKIFIRLALVIPVLIFVFLFTDTGKDALSAFIDRTKTFSYDVAPRLKDNFTPLKFLPDAGLAGYGIGTAYQGSMALVQDWGDMPREFEEEWERIVLELGLIGFVIVMLLRTYIFFYSWKVFKRIKSYELKLIALLVLLHQLFVFAGSNITFNYFENIIYWFLIGLLVSVSRLERNNAAKGSGISAR